MAVRKREWNGPDGKPKTAWVVDYKDVAGNRRLKTFARKKEADAFELTAKGEVRDGTHVAESVTKTVEEAGALWIKTTKASGLEQSSVEDYERLLRLHIVPFIGGLKLTALTTARIRAYEDELQEAGRSASMIKRTVSALGTLLSDAQERGLVVRNAVQETRGKRKGRKERQEKRQKGRLKVGVDIPTREEISALAGVLEGRWRPFILTAIFTGMRASELRGLRWQDVDLDAGKIRVHQRADRYNAIGRPKSETSERELPAPPIVINALREWKLQCPLADTGKSDAKGEKIKALELCFPNGAGKIENLRNILQRGLHPAWVRAGVTVETESMDEEGNPILAAKYSGLHCLRHWYASWLINRKEDGGLGLTPKVVQARMGHSTIALTMDVYSHLFPKDDDGTEMAAATDFVLSAV
ncbi:site-specific integrase [Agrobacterium fabrum]|uniref:site-specific integrase n=1 Tax=Agrobacterium fabrum TaxID=1176649 RepID=UPI0015743D13|nr:site-specific integrase [Agrobacterium fabrum]WIE26426.1 tyrosine-type recombinase/integrase [Agrobacterium fabrum]WIE42383.1 tyrosine-type recombinase/integrase [Agrobacterium fabrum]